jgi:hypothetical protein
MTKRCARCHEVKPFEEFHRNSSKKDGLAHRCKPCAREVYRQWKEKNPERARAAWRRAYERYAPKIVCRRYGLSERELALLREAQEYRCAICGIEEYETEGRNPGVLYVDHIDGMPIKVRGLLCHNCNAAIGLFGHNPKLLQQAAAYLEDPPAERILRRKSKRDIDPAA